MKEKPVSIKIISLCYLLAPVINTLQLAYLNHWPLTGARGVFNHFSNYDWLLLACFPVVAIGIYQIAKWGNILFLCFSIFLISHNAYSYIRNPVYSLYVVLLFNLGTLGIVGFFLQKHIFAAYFNPRLRWWEHPFRYKAFLTAVVKLEQAEVKGNILDLSTSGCFLESRENFSLGDIFKLSATLQNVSVQVEAQVVWVKAADPKGYGMMFLKVSMEEKSHLQKMLDLIKNEPSKTASASRTLSNSSTANASSNSAKLKPDGGGDRSA